MRHFLRHLRALVILAGVPVGGSFFACGGGGDGGAPQNAAAGVNPPIPAGHLVFPPVTSSGLSGKYGIQSWLEQTGDSFSMFAKIYSAGVWSAPLQVGTPVGAGTSIDPILQTATDPNGNCVQVWIERSSAGSTLFASSNRSSDRTWLGPQALYCTALQASSLNLVVEPAKDEGGSVLYYVASVRWSEKTQDMLGAVSYAAKSCRFRTDSLGVLVDLSKIIALVPTLSSATFTSTGDVTSSQGSILQVIGEGVSGGTPTFSPTYGTYQPK